MRVAADGKWLRCRCYLWSSMQRAVQSDCQPATLPLLSELHVAYPSADMGVQQRRSSVPRAAVNGQGTSV